MITFTACSKNAVYRSLFSSSCWINITFSSVWQLGEMCHCLELICCEIRLRENDVHMKCILYIWLYDIHHTLDRDPSTSISSVKLAAENHLILSVSSRTVPHGACAPQAGDPAAAVRAKQTPHTSLRFTLEHRVLRVCPKRACRGAFNPLVPPSHILL